MCYELFKPSLRLWTHIAINLEDFVNDSIWLSDGEDLFDLVQALFRRSTTLASNQEYPMNLRWKLGIPWRIIQVLRIFPHAFFEGRVLGDIHDLHL